VAVPVIGMALSEGSKLIGLKTIPVPVVGTGSMYPSLFWAKSEGGPEDEGNVVIEEYRSTPHLYKRYGGFTLLGKKYLERQIGRGDMVAFKNAQTRQILESEGKDSNAGFIKRIIAIPGDSVELRDGYVYLNAERISEPYIAAPRSTYGGEYLKDCQKITVPENEYFVLGDNRKVSSDSRFELKLVKKSDIEYILPLSEQKIYRSLWRDTSKDGDLQGQPTLSRDEFVVLVNEVRKDKHIPPLKPSSALITSSERRGQKLLVDDQTKYDMKQATSDAHYSNIILGEFVSHGHFSAKELLENLLYNAGSGKQILNSSFTDLGVSAVNREVDGCPSQVIVGHLGGYVPASYDPSTLESWKNLRDNISSVLPSWEAAVGNNQVNQDQLTALLSILYRRLELAKEVVTTMEKKEWLSDAQQARIKADEDDAKKSEVLAGELNKK
jgi:signal peptidase I